MFKLWMMSLWCCMAELWGLSKEHQKALVLCFSMHFSIEKIPIFSHTAYGNCSCYMSIAGKPLHLMRIGLCIKTIYRHAYFLSHSDSILHIIIIFLQHWGRLLQLDKNCVWVYLSLCWLICDVCLKATVQTESDQDGQDGVLYNVPGFFETTGTV